jgi:hypothetical protein
MSAAARALYIKAGVARSQAWKKRRKLNLAEELQLETNDTGPSIVDRSLPSK